MKRRNTYRRRWLLVAFAAAAIAAPSAQARPTLMEEGRMNDYGTPSVQTVRAQQPGGGFGWVQAVLVAGAAGLSAVGVASIANSRRGRLARA